MNLSAIQSCKVDPTPIFELFRGSYATELLTAAVSHFRLFDKLKSANLGFDELRQQLGLERRPAHVLFTFLQACGLLAKDQALRYTLTPLAQEHLISGNYFDVSDYIGLAANSPGVKAIVERLISNRPAGTKPTESGAAFIFREGLESAMERESSARSLTLALAGRAKNVAPILASHVPLENSRVLLDIGGGTGIYSIACLQKNPQLRAIVFDRPEVLKVASEMAQSYSVADRLECCANDMFSDPIPQEAEVILLSNVLHDWDEPECLKLIERCADALPRKGRLLIHDVFLNDALDGPLPIALYSAALFTLTEGRAYSAAEYKSWLERAGLQFTGRTETLIHCGVLSAEKL